MANCHGLFFWPAVAVIHGICIVLHFEFADFSRQGTGRNVCFSAK